MDCWIDKRLISYAAILCKTKNPIMRAIIGRTLLREAECYMLAAKGIIDKYDTCDGISEEDAVACQILQDRANSYAKAAKRLHAI